MGPHHSELASGYILPETLCTPSLSHSLLFFWVTEVDMASSCSDLYSFAT